MAEIHNAADLGEGYRHQVSEALCTAFAEDFRHFAKDPAVLPDAFAHALQLEYFWVALIDDSVAAVATLTGAGERCLQHDRGELLRHLGPIRGRIAALAFRGTFEQARTDLDRGTVEIGFVGSSPRFRGRGAARQLLQHFLDLPQYREYLLEEIKDTNVPALSLYRSLGFSEYKRRRIYHTPISGFRFYVSMKLTQPG